MIPQPLPLAIKTEACSLTHTQKKGHREVKVFPARSKRSCFSISYSSPFNEFRWGELVFALTSALAEKVRAKKGTHVSCTRWHLLEWA